MRRSRPPSETGRLAAPLVALFDAAWQRMHWWVGTMAVLYTLSGITVVRADEVALVLRWGRLVGATRLQQEHGPGLMITLPRPIDRVVRVPVKRIWEVPVHTLSADPRPFVSDTLDPLTGYALTGDHNVVHVAMMARYRIREAAEWALYGPPAEAIVRTEVTAAMVRSLGEMGVDRVLADGRTALIGLAAARAQAALDAAKAGLELTSLELTDLRPPAALARDFADVQSAFIGAETGTQDARAYAQTVVPDAHASVDRELQAARAAATAATARANGEAAAFLALAREYRTSPVVVRERLYRDAVEQAIAAAGSVRWIPPPVGGRYQGLRLTLAPDTTDGAGTSTAVESEEP